MKFMLFPELEQLAQALSHSSQECTVHTRIEAYSCKPIKKDKKLSKVMETNFQEVKAEIKQSVGSPDEDEESLFASPFGHLNKAQSRKTLYLLIQLLNVAFPDYDFSEAKPDHFCKEVNGSSVLHALSETLHNVRTKSGPRLVYAPRTYSTYIPNSPDLNTGTPPISSPLSRSPFMLSPATSSTMAKPLPYYHHALSSGVHPTLYQVLDKVIQLEQCDVYSYIPDMESDPHADDSNSDDDSSEFSSPDDEEDYDYLGFEDFGTSSSPPKAPYGNWTEEPEEEPIHGRQGNARPQRTAGGLLWSSHWFLHNRKQKRILFITIWAKKRRGYSESSEVDSFIGWEGGVGAGARAMGLPIRG